MNWAPYARYRAVDTTWLGQVPDHWETRNPKSLFRLRREPAHADDRQLTASQSDGVVYQDEYMENRGTRVVQVIEGQAGLKHVAAGDFVISLRSFQGGIEYSAAAGKISPAYTILQPLFEADHRYFAHLLKSDGFIQELRSTSNQLRDGQSLGIEHFAQVRVPLPPKSEQRAIGGFLDRETAKIDALIDKQEQLIATLREDRAATITQAVTKGLDQSVELCRTGIDFMDAIPSHWSVRKLKHLVERFEQGVSPQASAELATEGWGVLKSGCVNGGAFKEIEHKKLPKDFEFDERLAVAVGDLLVCRASGSPNLVGSAAIVQKLGYQLILSDKIFRLTPYRRSSLDYLEWALNARPYREQVLGAISGAEGLANNLPLSSLRNFWFADPPIAEQQEIARFLGERCTKIDSLIAKSTEMIETLREYRSALITNAVTGKIDVREAV